MLCSLLRDLDARPSVFRALPYTGGNKPQEAAQDAAASVKSALPDKPEEAAKDAASAAKDSLPEPPKDIQNPFQNLFGGDSPLLAWESCLPMLRKASLSPVDRLTALPPISKFPCMSKRCKAVDVASHDSKSTSERMERCLPCLCCCMSKFPPCKGMDGEV